MSDYDELPYRSMPFPETQPAHLGALSALFGRTPPPIETARVLELGCASGGNIMPLAMRFPDARFEGIDLGARHVDEGRAQIKTLGLGNITLAQGDIAAFDPEGRQFDYILCHGVFSWTPKPVQEAIFRICAQSLSGNGLAYISYNVLPGWHLRRIVRDMCRRHAGEGPDTAGRVARAREMLEHILKLADDATLYGKSLREEARRNQRMDDSYILGELLSEYNAPCLFEDFVARAAEHGLGYLCDAGIGETLVMPGAEQKAALGSDSLAIEQHMDLFTGRAFRRSVLVRGTPARNLRADGLGQLHFSCSMTAETGQDGALTLKRGAASLATNDPAVGAALTHLAAVYPDTRTLDELSAHASQTTGEAPKAFAGRLMEALMRTVLQGHVTASACALKVGQVDSPHPALWPLAQAQLKAGQGWVSSCLHTPIDIPAQTKALIGLLDGRPRAEIEARLSQALDTGEIVVKGMDTSASSAARAQQLLHTLLLEFRRSGLLAVD